MVIKRPGNDLTALLPEREEFMGRNDPHDAGTDRVNDYNPFFKHLGPIVTTTPNLALLKSFIMMVWPVCGSIVGVLMGVGCSVPSSPTKSTVRGVS